MRTVRFTEVSADSEAVIKAYITGNINNLTTLAKHLTKTENKTINRQSAVNMVANVLPAWYMTGKIDLGHSANTVEELNNAGV